MHNALKQAMVPYQRPDLAGIRHMHCRQGINACRSAGPGLRTSVTVGYRNGALPHLVNSAALHQSAAPAILPTCGYCAGAPVSPAVGNRRSSSYRVTHPVVRTAAMAGEEGQAVPVEEAVEEELLAPRCCSRNAAAA